MTEAWKQYEGQVVDGKFHLRQFLGSSDHSTAFLTELDPQGTQKAAIKFVAVDTESSQAQIERWQLAAKLAHPHLIQIFQIGKCHLGGRDLLFVVTEFAEENLAQILPHRALTAEEAGDMLPPVLDALAYLHSQGLVHGHLKPANIMAVRDQLKISSDGLYGVGTPAKMPEPSVYDAPEIATGISPASDVWSLGMTLVEVLTQRPLLWDGSMRGEPVIPETVPSPFRNIASHCLRQERQQRWTVAEITASLQSPQNGSRKPADAEPSRYAANSHSSKPLTRSRFIGPIVAVAVLLLAIVGGRKLLNRQSEETPAQAVQPSAAPSSNESEDKPKAVVPETAKPAPSPVPHHADKPAQLAASGSGSVVQQVLPEVSRSARNTIEGRIKVRVKVEVDSSGNVTAAKFESAGPSQYFANKTLEAARQWKFAPGQVDGQAVASEWVLKFAIGRASTTVQSAQAKR